MESQVLLDTDNSHSLVKAFAVLNNALDLIVVLPSKWIGRFPFLLRETLAFGRPSIVSDITTASRCPIGGSGAVAEAGYALRLAETIAEVIDNQPRREKMSHFARF